jgi:hypothetical protein
MLITLCEPTEQMKQAAMKVEKWNTLNIATAATDE